MLHVSHLAFDRAVRLSILRQTNFALMVGWAYTFTWGQPFESAPAVYRAMADLAPQPVWGWVCWSLVALGLVAFWKPKIVRIVAPIWVSWWAFTAAVFAVGTLQSMGWMLCAGYAILMGRSYIEFFSHQDRPLL